MEVERVKIRPELLRVRIPYEPEWEGACEGWAVNYINAHVWRYGPLHRPEDLLQEAWLKFNDVATKCESYSPRHFMALFKVSVIRHFMNITAKQCRQPTMLSLSLSASGGEADGGDAETGGGDTLETLLLCSSEPDPGEETISRMFEEEAPPPVARLLRQLVDATTRQHYQWKGRVRETTNQFLARVAGVDEESESIVEQVLRYIEGDTLCLRSGNLSI